MKLLFFGSIAVIAAKPQRALGLGICTCRSRPTAVRESGLLLIRSSNRNLVPVSLAAHR
jgi:hypothetical protein